MAVPLTRLSWWWWGGKEKDQVTNGSAAMNPLPDWGFGLKEPESLRFRSVMGAKMASSSTRKVKRKWKSREERRRRIDKEYDVVLVPSDGVCLSGSESDDSDWSIGWLEPHAPDFQSDDEGDNSFAVLVPCYRHDCKELDEEEEVEPSNQFLSAIRNLPNEYSSGHTTEGGTTIFCTLMNHICFIMELRPLLVNLLERLYRSYHCFIVNVSCDECHFSLNF